MPRIDSLRARPREISPRSDRLEDHDARVRRAGTTPPLDLMTSWTTARARPGTGRSQAATARDPDRN